MSKPDIHKAGMRVRCLTGAGVGNDSEWVPIHFDQRIFRNGTMEQRDYGWYHVFSYNDEEQERLWDPDGATYPGDPTLYYAVGSWQGDEDAWSQSARTPNF